MEHLCAGLLVSIELDQPGEPLLDAEIIPTILEAEVPEWGIGTGSFWGCLAGRSLY